MNSTSLILGHFANLKLAGDRAIRDAILSLQAQDTTLSTASAMRTIFKHPPQRRRRRRRKSRTTRVNAMSDADLEAELTARRVSRARERDRYARSMRSEKLSVLESELSRLRSEIARIGKSAPLGGGTPPTAKWESLSSGRRSTHSQGVGGPPSRSGSLPSRGTSGVPPSVPPPVPPPPMSTIQEGEDAFVIDPERQRREKEERQRRREAKRKEREAARKPMTLADIIRGAGPDAAKKLKPSGSTPLPTVKGEGEEEKKEDAFGTLRNSLKKVEKASEENKEGGEGKEVSKENGGEEEGMDSGNKGGKLEDKGGKELEKSGVANAIAEELVAMPENGNIDGGKTKMADAAAQSETEMNGNSTNANAEGKESPGQSESDTKDVTEEKVTIPHQPLPLKTKENEEPKPSSAVLGAENRTSVAVAETSENSTNDETQSAKSTNDEKVDAAKESAADAISAISSLAASLPTKKVSSVTATRSSTRKTLEQKRKLRRASNAAKSANGGQAAADISANMADTLAAVNALKLD